MKKLKYFLALACLFAFVNMNAQTTINLADQCNCEVIKSSTEISAGATAPAGSDNGDILIDPSGDLFFWDGDSWEVPTAAQKAQPWFDVATNMEATSNTQDIYQMGNVGIGTTTPTERLSVQGKINTGGGIEINELNTGDRNAFLDLHSADSTDYSTRLLREPGADGQLLLRNRGAGDIIIQGDFNQNRIHIQGGTGNVGIGVSNAATKLDVNGDARVRIIPPGAATDAVVTTDADGNLRRRTAAEIVAEGGGNVDDQTLALTGTNLSIESGNTVDLSALQDGTGTDDQSLTLTGTNLSIEDGNTVDLSSLSDGDAWGVTGEDQAAAVGRIGNVTLGQNTGADQSKLDIVGTDRTSHFHFGGEEDTYVRGGTNTGDVLLNDNGGNVGIGTNAPQAKLQISPDTAFFGGVTTPETLLSLKSPVRTGIKFATTADFRLGDLNPSGTQTRAQLDIALSNGSTNSANNNVMTLLGNGQVGINTTDPTTALSVNGSINTSSSLEVGQLGSGDRNSIIDFHSEDGVDRSFRIRRFEGADGIVQLGNNGTGAIQFLTDFGSTRMTINGSANNGNVGIGIVNAEALLDVNGDARIRNLPAGAVSDGIVTTDGNGNLRQRTAAEIVAAGGGLADGSETLVQAGTNATVTGTGTAGDPYIINGIADTTDGDAWGVTGEDQAADIARTGGVTLGQNTASAASKLDIVGTDRQSHFHFGANEDIYLRGGTNNGNVLLNDSGGRVGIGTTTPEAELHVRGVHKVSKDDAGVLQLTEEDLDNSWFLISDANDFNIRENGTANSDTRFSIEQGGNVGIGITAPATKLDIRDAEPTLRLAAPGEIGGAIQFGNASHGVKRGFAGADNNVGLYTTSGNLSLSTNGESTGEFVLVDNGNVGIGTVAPRGGLEISGSPTIGQTIPALSEAVDVSSDDYNLVLSNSDNATIGTVSGFSTASGVFDTYFQARGMAANGPAYNLLFNPLGGRVGIGTAAPTSRLDVDGFARVRGIPAGAATDGIVTTDADGNLRQRTAAQVLAAAGGGADGDAWAVDGEDQAADIARMGGVTLGQNTASAASKLDIVGTDRQSHFHFGANEDIYLRGGTNNGNVLLNDSGGRVGIGTNSPGRTLDVYGSQSITGPAAAVLQLNQEPTNKNWYIINDGGYFVRENTTSADSSRFYIQPGGNIGLSTIAPSAKLTVASAGVTDETGGIRLENGVSNSEIFQNADADLVIQKAANPNQLVLNSDGRVGINTDSPTARLDVDGFARVRGIPAGVATDGIVTTDADGNLRQRTAAEIVAAGGGGADGDAWGVAGEDQAAAVGRTGNITLGQNAGADQSKLDIVGTDRMSHFHFGANEDTYVRGGTNDGNVLLNDNGGNVGIGTSNPQFGALQIGSVNDARFNSELIVGSNDGNAQLSVANDFDSAFSFTSVSSLSSQTQWSQGPDNGQNFARMLVQSGNQELLFNKGNKDFEMELTASEAFLRSNAGTGSNFAKINFHNGNIGINTNTPRGGLEISGSPTIGQTIPALSEAVDVSSDDYNLVLSNSDNATIGTVSGFVANPGSFDTYFQARGMAANGAAYNLLFNPLGGRVGIGTATPAANLDVAGDVRVGDVGEGNSNFISGDLVVGDATGNNSTRAVISNFNNASFRVNHNTSSSQAVLTSALASSSLDLFNNGNVEVKLRAASNSEASILTRNKTTFDEFGLVNNVTENKIISELGTGTAEMYFINGNIGIGVANPTTKLHVNGTITTASNTYPDYVFEAYEAGESLLKKDYEFKSLEEVETFIKLNKHLPGVTGIKELQKTEEGKYNMNITATSVQTLEKVEELFLYTIEQNKKIKELEAKVSELEELKAEMAEIKALLSAKK